jgi:Carboxypeptidase regulatory-like domain
MMGKYHSSPFCVLSFVAVLLLFSASLSFGECVEASPVNSSRNVRVIVLKDGKTQQKVKVELFAEGKGFIVSLLTDEHGIAFLPTLKPGFYSILASTGEDLEASQSLRVLDEAEVKMSSFTMNLWPNVTARMTAAAESAPVRARIQEFKGVVVDPSGAAIPGALVSVYPRGSDKKRKTVQIKADESGQFSAPLPEGIYTVVVGARAFRGKFVVFELVRDGETKPLQVLLQVDYC